MTYNEWRDELKSNLMSVPESEQRRVLAYYAEAYADRREAGYSERAIIAEFGAPYDAAQKILHEKVDEDIHLPPSPAEPEERSEKREKKVKKRRRSNIFLIIIGILILIPLCPIALALIIASVALCVAPFAMCLGGAGYFFSGIWFLFEHGGAHACMTIGAGIAFVGVGVILFPVVFKLVKLLWNLIGMAFTAVSYTLRGKEHTV